MRDYTETHQEYIEMIQNMDIYDLLSEIIENPEFLIDSYYNDFGRALIKRANELQRQ